MRQFNKAMYFFCMRAASYKNPGLLMGFVLCILLLADSNPAEEKIHWSDNFESGGPSYSTSLVLNDADVGGIIAVFTTCNFFATEGSPDSMFTKVNTDTMGITFDDPLYNGPAAYDFRVIDASPFLHSTVPMGAMGPAGPAAVTE